MRNLPFRPLVHGVLLVCLVTTAALHAQNGPPPGSTSTSGTSSIEGGPMTAPTHATPTPTTATLMTPAAPTATGPALDPSAAVKSVITMFTPNDLVSVPTLGKPLPLTGTWGAQTHFPNGYPAPCTRAAVPCIKVIYNLPEAKITCEWTLGYLVAVEPQPDGTIKHAVHEIVLDENADAAHYTMRKAWSRGDTRPRPVVTKSPDYPLIAADANTGGVVAVRLVIGPDGSVANAAIIGGPKLLQPAVLEAVRQWKFDPPRVGSQSTDYRIDEYFGFNNGRPDFSDAMDPSGKVMMQNGDPHFEPGFTSQGTSGEQWESCTAVTCVHATPPAPQ